MSFDDHFLSPSRSSHTEPFAMYTSIPSIVLHKNKIDVILDEQIVLTNDGKIKCFLVRWVDQFDFDCTWSSEEKLQQLDLDLLELYWSQQDFLCQGHIGYIIFMGIICNLVCRHLLSFEYLARQKDCPPWHNLEILDIRLTVAFLFVHTTESSFFSHPVELMSTLGIYVIFWTIFCLCSFRLIRFVVFGIAWPLSLQVCLPLYKVCIVCLRTIGE